MLIALIFYCEYNKITSWLKTTQTYYVIVLILELQNGLLGQNQSVNRAAFLLECLGESLFPGLLQHFEHACTPQSVELISKDSSRMIQISL